MPQLLADPVLEESSVVANCRMNRERDLLGSNGYDVELGFDPLRFLQSVVDDGGPATWLDLCCGSGRALSQAADEILKGKHRIEIDGVDLVGMFAAEPVPGTLRLIEASLSTWRPTRSYDLITCVHGLHYIGDKLTLISRAAGWLTGGGRLAANLDASNLVVSGYSKRVAIRALRDAGFDYDSRRRRLRVDGKREVTFPFRYLGADDRAGPNYTGQPAVDSHYKRRSR